jgi:prepilin-type N-terminal cleavage/methylation domain-containing protein
MNGGVSKIAVAQVRGFTLLEMLIVCAVLAVLLTIGVMNFQRFRATLELRQAQQIFVQELNRARSDARRLSQDQNVTWTAHSMTIGTREIQLLDSIELVKVKGSNDLTYVAPYGRLKATNYLFELRRGDLIREVYVYGVTGKIKAIGF